LNAQLIEQMAETGRAPFRDQGDASDDDYIVRVHDALRSRGTVEEARALIAARGPNYIMSASGGEVSRIVRDLWLSELRFMEPNVRALEILCLVQAGMNIDFTSEETRPIAKHLVWMTIIGQETGNLPAIVRFCNLSREDLHDELAWLYLTADDARRGVITQLEALIAA
jgi:hypothetical protein